MDTVKVWVVNIRGRPQYLEKRVADKLIEEGKVKIWPGGVPPKENYYPQLDETGGSTNIKEFESLGEGDEVLDVEIL